MLVPDVSPCNLAGLCPPLPKSGPGEAEGGCSKLDVWYEAHPRDFGKPWNLLLAGVSCELDSQSGLKIRARVSSTTQESCAGLIGL